SQSKIAQTLSLSFGSRKTCDPLQPCAFRFSAPLVENTFQKRSKSSIFAVAKTISASSCRSAIRVPTLRHFGATRRAVEPVADADDFLTLVLQRRDLRVLRPSLVTRSGRVEHHRILSHPLIIAPSRDSHASGAPGLR